MSRSRINGTAGLMFVAGLLAIASGIATLLAGALHPSPTDATTMHDAVLEMTASANWDAAHWASLAGFPLLAVTLALLIDVPHLAGRTTVLALARVALVGALFMAVEAAVHLVSAGERPLLAAGEHTPLLDVSQQMQTVGWPLFGLGIAGLALAGIREQALSGRWAGIVGAIGGIGLALGGFLTEGLEIIQAGILFPLGLLMSLWLIWVGVRLSRAALGEISGQRTAPVPTTPG